MKRIILILACLCCTLHAQQPVTVLNNGAGGGTFNTPGVTTYFGGANTFNFVGSVVTGLPANVGNTFTTLAVTGTTQLNGNVGIGGPFNPAYGIYNQSAFTIGAASGADGYVAGSNFTFNGNGGLAASTNLGGGSSTLATGAFTGLTYNGIRLGSPAVTGSGSGSAYQIDILNGPAFTSLAGIAVASQTNGATNNTDILYGTTTIPSGAYGIYQGDSDPNLFAGTTTFDGAIIANSTITCATGFVTNGTGSGNAGSMYGSAISGLILQEKSGATTDFNILDPTGANNIIQVPHGSTEVVAGLAGAAAIGINGGVGAVTSSAELVKTVGSIANNTGTAVLTVTIPNSAQSAMVHVVLTGSLGAGGAIGANEATGTISYDFAVARTAGVNAVTTASTAYGSAAANVAGAATITITAAASAISGAVGVTNTFTVNVTIARGGGASTNHTCLVDAKVVNANATGITIN